MALTLASLFAEVQEEELSVFAAAGSQWLIGKDRVEDHPLPGLFVGEAGVCLALVRIGACLGDEELIESGRRRALEVASAPHDSPDIYHGTAGRILVHLAVWEQCGDGEQLDAAVRGGEFLLRTAEKIDGGIAWTIPPGYSSLSGERWLGFAHGAAGVGYAFIRLYEATGDAKFRAAAHGVADLLARHAVGPSVSQLGLSWPTSAGRELASPVWCHGSAGVGRFFLAAAATDIFSGAMELAKGCASAVATSTWLGPTKCHGLSGGIEYLLDIRDATGIPSYADDARNLGDLLTAFIVEDEARGPWPAEAGQWLPADLMVGYSGIALSILRLSGDRPAHVLLRDV